jgi:hypothetical protein
MLICGHSHRAIFASLSYADRLDKEMKEKQQEILDCRDNKKLIRQKLKELKKLQDKLLDEEMKNRKTAMTERNPLPCYFNTGCGVFTDGMTAIEIQDGIIRLVKWHQKVRNGQKRIVFKDCQKDLMELLAMI